MSVLMLHDVLKDNEVFRIDNQFYQKEFLLNSFNNVTWDYLERLCLIKSGTTPVDRDGDLDNGVILLKTNDIRNNVLSNDSSYFFIDQSTNEKMKSTELQENDVLVNIVGATTNVIGRTSIVPKDFPKANITQAMAFCRVKSEKVNPFYVFTFFITKFANKQVRRIARPTGQYNLNLVELGSFRIPLLSQEFQLAIECLVKQAHSKQTESKSLYATAEALLMEALGIDQVFLDSQTTNKPQANYNVVMLQDILTTNRLDAEYYQPKYEAMEAQCKKNANYVKSIKEIQVFNTRGLQPQYDSTGELDVINSRHILEYQLDYDNFEKTSLQNWNTQIRARVFKYDILTYTTGANIGRTQTYFSSNPALASNHVNILRVNQENPIYISFVLNSIIGRFQTEKLSAGSAQQELYPKDLDCFYIPFVTSALQTQIAQYVQQSFALQQQSKQLLALAKQAVEVAIEQNEAVSLSLIAREQGA